MGLLVVVGISFISMIIVSSFVDTAYVTRTGINVLLFRNTTLNI